MTAIFPAVPSQAEFNLLAAKVNTLATNLGALTTQYNALLAEVVADEALIAALQVPVPPVITLPPPSLPPVAGALVFSSDWASGTVKDTWDTYDEWTGGLPLGTMMSVASGVGLGGRNALKVMQRGELAAAVDKNAIIVPGQDYYVRFYFRNDDTSAPGDHIVAGDPFNYHSLIYLRKSGGPADWDHKIGLYGVQALYPIIYWSPAKRYPNGQWFRFEFFVHWTAADRIQVHPRVYDAAGTLLYQDADYRQEDYGASGSYSYLGNPNWTLASFYAAGHDFQVVPADITGFYVGNNGQSGASNTGLPWYFAGVAFSTAGWIGA